MHIIVADKKVVLVADHDDVAWDIAEEMKAEGVYEKIYTEEVYEADFDADGKYTTLENDIITLEDIKNAEHCNAYDDEDCDDYDDDFDENDDQAEDANFDLEKYMHD